MGGSSGGGGSSGAVSYPAYMETQHSAFLTAVATIINNEVTAGGPYVTATAYDPDTDLADNATKLNAFNSIVTAFDPDGDWSDLWEIAENKIDGITFPEISVLSEIAIVDKVAAYKAGLLNSLNNSVLPRYQRGMQNVRAVMTSAFVIGESLLTAEILRDVDKFEADLRVTNEETQRANDVVLQQNEIKKLDFISHATDGMMQAMAQQVEFYKSVTHYGIESNRIKIVSKQEEIDKNIGYDEKDALWFLELYQYGGNMLASISGAASATTGKGVSTGQSVLGGALSGAAAGGMIAGASKGAIGGPMGMIGGAILGGIGGLF